MVCDLLGNILLKEKNKVQEWNLKKHFCQRSDFIKNIFQYEIIYFE